MISKLWFRFGIPLGSATVLAALLESALSLYWFLYVFSSYLYFHVWEYEQPIDYRTVIGLIAVFFRAALTTCLWIFVIWGHKGILICWIPFSVIADILLIGHGINNCTHLDIISDEIWFINLTIVIVLRLYLTSVIYQAFNRLLQNAKAEAQIKIDKEQSQQNGNGSLNHDQPLPKYESANVRSHAGNVHRKNYPGTPHPTPSVPKYLHMEPIGTSLELIWDFYDYVPRLGAVLLATFELIWNVFILSTHSMTEFLLGGSLFFMPKEEEIFMRVWRILLGTVALWLLYCRRKTLLRFWIIVYFWTLFASLFIFAYIWIVRVDTPTIVVLVLCTTCLWDNILRFGVLYFCLRVTTQPPPNLELVRSHSLRSQSRTSRIYLDNQELNQSGQDNAIEMC